jgi:hypothetical protein
LCDERWVFHDTRHTAATAWFSKLNVQRQAQAHALSGMGKFYIDINPKTLMKMSDLYLKWHRLLFEEILPTPLLTQLEAPRLQLAPPLEPAF